VWRKACEWKPDTLPGTCSGEGLAIGLPRTAYGIGPQVQIVLLAIPEDIDFQAIPIRRVQEFMGVEIKRDLNEAAIVLQADYTSKPGRWTPDDRLMAKSAFGNAPHDAVADETPLGAPWLYF